MIDYIGETQINYRKSLVKVKSARDIFYEVEEFKNKLQEHFITIYLQLTPPTYTPVYESSLLILL
jgi:hypothetical protein